MSKEITDKAIKDIQKISLKCFGWTMGREQAIDVWCIIAYKKPEEVINKATRNIYPAAFRSIIAGCAELGVA